jgi:hypothetical protein
MIEATTEHTEHTESSQCPQVGTISIRLHPAGSQMALFWPDAF